MANKQGRKLEQHIAVFGEIGSGKTVLVSSFFGPYQEREAVRKRGLRVLARDPGQGNALHRNYLGMRDSAHVPSATRFDSTSYTFDIRLEGDRGNSRRRQHRPDATLVWHDYPGEWFESTLSGAQEEARRLETFRTLLGSDVALLLVDGQKLKDYQGEEERYLKSLFGNVKRGLLTLKDPLLENEGPLTQFPRIWVIALSKADLWPDLDVYAFRDMLIDKASDEIADLRDVIGGLVADKAALSVGEDFVRLSSARFDAGSIDLTQRVGLDLIMPMASVLPLERHLRWFRSKKLSHGVAKRLLDNAGPIAAAGQAIALKVLPGKYKALALLFNAELIERVAEAGKEQLEGVKAEATEKHDLLTATLAQFQLDLNAAERDGVILRSER
ncbi:ATP/GTP-binding protein [Demequina aurantiaca]|uniref:ATP/GTP-binding protein n=1 Tax=Demequina aurantiaca TaxID=676200 RepID=UPI003D34252F